jgi:glyoxylase-like metal-dependent hydrolase (beta-lactamase superfamily II)
MSLKITVLTFPCFSANCYLVTDEGTGESLLIDPGSYGERQKEYIKSQGVESLRYILLTHGHFDHMLGVERFRNAFGGQVVVHEEDADKLFSAQGSLYSRFEREIPFASAEADLKVRDGDRLPFGGGEIEVIHTPGHSKGSVCYKLGDVIFSGDTLFRCSVGRTDFPDSDGREMLSSLKKLSAIEGECKIYPGHEGATTLSFEKNYNPYMKLCR